MSPQEPQAQKTCSWQPGSLELGRASGGPQAGLPVDTDHSGSGIHTPGLRSVLQLKSCTTSDNILTPSLILCFCKMGTYETCPPGFVKRH